jgi:hypothetical protein
MMNKLTAIKIKNYSSEQTGIVTVHRPDSLKLILSLAICPLARVVWMAVLGGEIYAQDLRSYDPHGVAVEGALGRR